MIEPSMKDAITREIARLDESDRRRVLDFAQSLAERTLRGTPGASLIALAGSVPDEDMIEIEAAIAEVDPGGW